MKVSLLLVLVMVVLVIGLPVSSQGNAYTMHVLNSWGESFAYDINDSGQIVGAITSYGPYVESAVLWDNYASNAESLDEGNTIAIGYFINNSGVVLGEHQSTPGTIMPFRWSAASGVTNIDVPISMEEVNGSGNIVGWTTVSDMRQVPVVLGNTGVVTYLDYTCGNGGVARDINDSGYIVGDSYTPEFGGNACLWHEGVTTIDMGTFGGTWSHALGINNSGQVIGVYGGDEGAIGNFIWNLTGETMFIPSSPLLDGGSFGMVDINDSGVVLGNAEINGIDTVVTWSQTGGLTIVGTGTAYAINNSGWIVGINDLNNSQAIVWQPVPEPSSILTLLCGVSGAGALRLRRRK